MTKSRVFVSPKTIFLSWGNDTMTHRSCTTLFKGKKDNPVTCGLLVAPGREPVCAHRALCEGFWCGFLTPLGGA
ncbi:hypothetical protein POPTR_009G147650v4 [Populus trichocarpa]|uniref:Uncharacterized protein n=2 Tax=Populus trichocarpa TaxID=3694 RepID=A0ACC0SIC9_POPTR|nr:hypothetical protein POPTR_009G147650v4 [Populus trichocarpa]KAI9388980.1 hypothetical protein POPTR_009G147650v4 [Populus trichocarpa]